MPIGLDRPPLPPPEVTAQMGAGPPPEGPPGGGLAGVPPRPGAPSFGAPNPHGAALAQVEAVKRVLEQLARMEPVMAPFAQKATQILQDGIAAVTSAPPGAAGGPPPAPGPPGPGPMPPLG